MLYHFHPRRQRYLWGKRKGANWFLLHLSKLRNLKAAGDAQKAAMDPVNIQEKYPALGEKEITF